MIPVKLSLRNFMCYRENVPPLHFDGIHTACISGDNGNGKSALIDAMTWALWGKTRAKSDLDLIHQGQTEMAVEFDFTVGQQLYRIIRKYAKPRRQRASGQPLLDFQIATENGFRSISGNTILETQGKVSQVLHMDYPTFINSAFLRQGHADEFTTKRPVERKEVLASILGLSLYDDLEERAKNVARQQETETTQLENAIQDIGGELSQRPTFEAEFDRIQGELTGIEKTVTEGESRLKLLRQERDTLENRRLQLVQLEERISETERDINQWQEQAKQHRSQIKEYEEIIARRSAVETGYNQLTETKKQNDELDYKFRQSVNLEKQRSQLEIRIKEAGQSLLTEHALVQNKITELESSRQRLPQLKDELHQIEAQQQYLSKLEDNLRQKRESQQELQAQVKYLETSIQQQKKEIAETEGKLKMLLDQHEARCPLCETELGREGIRLVETKYTSERDTKSNSMRANQGELADRRKQLESLEGEISRQEEELRQAGTAAQSRSGVLNSEIKAAEEAGNRLDKEKERLVEIEHRLASKDFATAEQQALAEIEAELGKLNYDARQHEEVRQRLISLQQHEDARRRLEEADRLINQEQDAASRAEAAAEQRRNSLETARRKSQELTAELEALPRLSDELAQAEAENKTLTDQQKQVQETLWNVKAKLERFSELEVKKGEKEKRLEQVSRDEKIYRELAQAFGKRGIQAMLIEAALPEIEIEANKLLSRMTDNRMQVKIETQRETRKGDLTETLDINIADELGTRSYEMFSGGEAFRINFAIRIALSKLLARRAGAPLRTLIVDEGFGTQDSSGIEKIKEAISSIEEDFDRILVITHINELRDAFPTRIEVVKTGEGSTLKMS